jgi:predicted GTPase
VPEEPFRVLVLGQVSSGKSSLINALFGEPRAATDVLAHTREFAAYRLERDGMPVALILDSRGYAGGETRDGADMDRELLRSDLILLVCAAHHAARAADRAQLERLRRLYRDHPQRQPPALLCALTFIDRLRPLREWSPPYDIIEPATPKAHSIRAAVDHIAAALALDPARVVPVRTDAGRLYNIDEALVPRIMESLADDAARARYLRCLRHRQQTGQWQRLLRQTRNAGRLLAAAGGRLGNQTWKKGRDWLDEWR